MGFNGLGGAAVVRYAPHPTMLLDAAVLGAPGIVVVVVVVLIDGERNLYASNEREDSQFIALQLYALARLVSSNFFLATS